jgi:hypothetical protein
MFSPPHSRALARVTAAPAWRRAGYANGSTPRCGKPCWKCEEAAERDQQEKQKHPQPSKDEAEIVADCAEDDVDGVAGSAFAITTTEVAVGLDVADCGFDGGVGAAVRV